MESLQAESQTRMHFRSWLDSGTKADTLFDLETVVPREVLPRKRWPDAYAISCFRDLSERNFLDEICLRLREQGSGFFANPADALTVEWTARLKAIRRDVHKAHAFVRFKKLEIEGSEFFVAWHRPQHATLDLFVRLFCRRFPKMNWMVATSSESAHFSSGKLKFGPGCPEESLQIEDNWEEHWRTYYASIFNPARLMVQAMQREMPKWHWRTLPESRLIPDLIRRSANTVARMETKAQSSAAAFVPGEAENLSQLSDALPRCEGCRLHAHCRPTFGAGNAKASLFLLGEQPGDEEEKQGMPFVGPAGQLLRQAAEESGIDWLAIYVSNAVKHFKYEYRGPYRLHKRPERDEVAACRPWLQKEFSLVRPKVVVCLGSTAALSASGRLWPVERYRGTWLPSSADHRLLLTYHPAAILRAPPEKSAHYYRDLVADLRLAREAA